MAAVVVAVVCVRAWYLHRIGGSWTMIPLNLFPFALLEGLGRVPRTRLSTGVFAAGAALVSLLIVFHLPILNQGAGEWARLNFLFIPAAQTAGAVVLGVMLGALRALGR